MPPSRIRSGARASPTPTIRTRSRPAASTRPSAPAPPKAEYEAYVAGLLALRRERLAPHLAGATSLGASTPGPQAVRAEWRLANGLVLGLAAQFGDEALPLSLPPHTLLAESAPGVADSVASAELPPRSAIAWLREEAA
ncbi:DUF3459 domain-containing protein [Pseudoroseomonas cervicalis]|uniref:DUF3459 domain-containing protein n=1 Tax=Teichococcus cervicalis TaxID=204525 RepID=UPI00278692C0|nr:DUF3459 domain-containing protein [Pseudoroseomonas cervicalis]MDQ1078787.1 hypothetical protein [Pseudoroseomonas cervicalis]